MSKQFHPPAFVYVYIDKNTDLPVYIGKVNAGNSLDSRINSHRSDFWFDEKNQEIYYTPVESSSTADMLETAMINYYKKKGVALYNIAKTTWGETSYLSKDNFGWIPYVLYNKQMLKINENKIKSMDYFISMNERKIHDIQVKKEMIQKKYELYNIRRFHN